MVLYSLHTARTHYRRVHHPERPGQISEHRLVAAQKLGRALQPREVVHHCDGDRSNNHPDNLEVLPSQRVHMAREWYERRLLAGVSHLFELDEWLRIYAR